MRVADSRLCQGQYAEAQKNSNHANTEAMKYMALVNCETCGTVFYARPSTLAAGHGRFCSKPCKGVSMLGNVPGNASHMDSRSLTFRSWESMHQRCMNSECKDFQNYGGRGISICERWLHSYENFLDDMGERPAGKTLDRYPNNNGNYEPGNCRWATNREQSNNRRSSRVMTANGRTQTVAQWARELGASRQAIRYRIEAGWSPEQIVSQPI
jgi:hypothetical protein